MQKTNPFALIALLTATLMLVGCQSIPQTTLSPTPQPTPTYSLVVIDGTFPNLAQNNDVNAAVVNAYAIPSCGTETVWVKEYIFLALEVGIENQTPYPTLFDYFLYDKVANRYTLSLRDVTKCYPQSAKLEQYLEPGQSHRGMLLYEVALTTLLTNPHLQIRSYGDPYITIDINLSRDTIQFDPSLLPLPTPVP